MEGDFQIKSDDYFRLNLMIMIIEEKLRKPTIYAVENKLK